MLGLVPRPRTWLLLAVAGCLLLSCNGKKDLSLATPSAPAPSTQSPAGAPKATPPDASAANKAPAPPAKAPTLQVATGGSQGWTTFRGNSARTGQADINGPRTADVKWVFRTRGRLYADAAVTPDGNTIYVGSHDHRFYALNADGTQRWSFDTGDKIWSSPAIGEDGTVYVGTDNDMMLALTPQGRKRWGFVTTERPARKGEAADAVRYVADTSPPPLLDCTIVFGWHLRLIALRPSDADVRWIFTAGQGRAKIFSSPVSGPTGNIFFGTQGDQFFALSESAAVQWTAETDGDIDATAVAGPDGTVYFAADDGVVRAWSLAGVEKWRTSVGAPVRAPLALGRRGELLVSTYDTAPVLVALNASDGAERWRFAIRPGEGDFYGIQSGALIDASGHVYFGGRDHYVYCLSPEGRLVWEYETGDQVDAGPVLGPDGTLYIGSDDHRLYAFGATAPQPSATPAMH